MQQPESNFAWRLRLHASVIRQQCADPEARAFYGWLADHLLSLIVEAESLDATNPTDFEDRRETLRAEHIRELAGLRTESALYHQLIAGMGRPPKPVVEVVPQEERFAVYDVGGGRLTFHRLLDHSLVGHILGPKWSRFVGSELSGGKLLAVDSSSGWIYIGAAEAVQFAKAAQHGLSWLPAEAVHSNGSDGLKSAAAGFAVPEGGGA